ncbi:hypothetical protein PVAP13_6KG269406 [Panicum virgatum]|uniref:Uncharacterized protein n=1 Tax=Panicum virgatum TaxID=38727 RepID=A0A8T0RH93_PANVG|nr:hypothetical protein PVAP13_6KG269406 [Panicum virgatum]
MQPLCASWCRQINAGHSCWKPQHRMESPAEGQLDRQNPRAKKIRGLVPLSMQLRRSCNQQVNK